MSGTRDTRQAETYYDEFAGRYDKERRAGYFGFINAMEFETIRALATARKTLEVGCGTGLILEMTRAVAGEAHGVDISEGMLDVCRSKGLNVRHGAATALPFADGSFDLTYSFKVLAHVREIRQAVREIARVTRPGGHMVLEFYNRYSVKFLLDSVRGYTKPGAPVYLRHDSIAEIESYLPDGIRIMGLRGIRIFGPAAGFYTAPGLGPLFRWLDRAGCDGPLGRLGGYLVVQLGSGGPGVE